MTSIKKVLGFGVLTWLIPFILAFAFYTPQGEIRIDLHLFKSIMIVVASLVGSFLLVRYFKNVHKNYLKEGMRIGVLWLGMNLVLDVLLLIPMSHMSFGDYIAQIGLRYLMIPIFSIGFGMALENSQQNQK
ncbi:MAG: hypothetical protein HYV32_05120 [Candidatus Kerfeldbacteria bacterium]|nr:hypothetical protein [Candidatus Kerfeldbacteria bacterium]